MAVAILGLVWGGFSLTVAATAVESSETATSSSTSSSTVARAGLSAAIGELVKPGQEADAESGAGSGSREEGANTPGSEVATTSTTQAPAPSTTTSTQAPSTTTQVPVTTVVSRDVPGDLECEYRLSERRLTCGQSQLAAGGAASRTPLVETMAATSSPTPTPAPTPTSTRAVSTISSTSVAVPTTAAPVFEAPTVASVERDDDEVASVAMDRLTPPAEAAGSEDPMGFISASSSSWSAVVSVGMIGLIAAAALALAASRLFSVRNASGIRFSRD